MTTERATTGSDLARYCGATTKHTKTPCKRPAGWGTDHVGFGVCKLHLGCTRNHSKRWEQAVIDDRIATEFGALLQGLEDDLDGVDMLDRLAEKMRRADAMTQVLGKMVGDLGPGSLYGPDHNGDGKPHVLVTMYQTWNEQAARLAKLAKDAGLEERRVAMDEDMAALVHSTIEAALDQQLALVEGGMDMAQVRRERPSLISGVLEATAREVD